ncbi:hypothetical protein [Yeosuana sp. AK3]
MNNIKVCDLVKYIGKTNDYTYEKDIKENSFGTVKNVFEVDGKTIYHIEFQNGIITTINFEDLKKVNLNEEKGSWEIL